MADIFVNTDRLAEAYYYLSKFDEYENSISDYQQNIKNAFLGCINNQELAELLNRAAECLSRSKEKCASLMQGMDAINSVCEWCNEESMSVVTSLGEIKTSQSGFSSQSNMSTYDSRNSINATQNDNSLTLGEIFDNVKMSVKGIGALSKIKKTSNIEKIFKDGYVYLKGYTKNQHLTSRYKVDTFFEKQTKFTPLEKAVTILKSTIATGGAIAEMHDIWNDANRTKDEKIIDTASVGFCTAASIALDVGAQVAGKAVAAAIPIPVVNVVVGCAVEFVVGTMAETMRSEVVVNQVSDSIDNVVGAAKAGAAVVSKAAEDLKNSETVGDAIANTAKLVGQAVVAGVQVVGTAVVETVKTAATVVVETVKNVGKKIENFFKGW